MNNQKLKISWNTERDEVLIEAVRKRPELYDVSLTIYNDNVAKKRAWKEVGEQLNTTSASCKERWESLRSQYRKKLKAAKTKSGESTTKYPKWKYEDHMSFLQVYMKDRRRMESLEMEDDGSATGEGSAMGEQDDVDLGQVKYEDDEQEENTTAVSPTPPQILRPPISHKQQTLSQTSCTSESPGTTLMRYMLEDKRQDNNSPHPIDQFFSLMATTVKQFSPADQHYVKTKVFLLVSEVEAKYLHPQQNTNQNAFLVSLPSSSNSAGAASSTSAHVPFHETLRSPSTSSSAHGVTISPEASYQVAHYTTSLRHFLEQNDDG